MANFLSYLSPAYAFNKSRKNQQDPFAAALPYIQQQRDMYERNYSPYTEAGSSAVGNVSGLYERMANDPAAYFDQIMSGYSPTKGFDEYKRNNLYKTVEQAGLVGGDTDYNKEMKMRVMNDLIDADKDKWLDRVLGLHGAGLGGQSHLAEMGLNATGAMSQGIGSALGQEGQIAYMSKQRENDRKNSLIRSLLGLGGAGLGALFGGPTGAMAGANIGSGLGGGFSGNYGGNSLDMGSWNTGLGR